MITSDIRMDSPWLKSLLEQGAKEGIEFHLITIVENHALKECLDYFKAFVFKSETWSLYSKLHLVKFVGKAFFQLLKFRPSVVHCHGFIASLLFIPSAFFLRIQNRYFDRHYGALHHLDRRRIGTFLDLVIGSFSTRIVVHSKAAESNLANLEPMNAPKLVNIYLGVPNTFKPTKVPKIRYHLEGLFDRPPSILVGVNARGVSYKGVDVLLDCAEFLNVISNDFGFLFLNISPSDPLYPRFQGLKNSNVRHLQTVESVNEFYNSVDVFCHVPKSMYAEPAGLVYIEAMKTGVPCIFTSSGILNDFHLLPRNVTTVNFQSYIEIARVLLDQQRVLSLRCFPVKNEFLNSLTLERYAREQISFYFKDSITK